MDYLNEFYHDGYMRRLGEALEEDYAREDCMLLKKLEHRLTFSLDKEKQALFINFVDAYRRQFMRAEGHSYMKGFFMGLDAGKILANHEQERAE